MRAISRPRDTAGTPGGRRANVSWHSQGDGGSQLLGARNRGSRGMSQRAVRALERLRYSPYSSPDTSADTYFGSGGAARARELFDRGELSPACSPGIAAASREPSLGFGRPRSSPCARVRLDDCDSNCGSIVADVRDGVGRSQRIRRYDRACSASSIRRGSDCYGRSPAAAAGDCTSSTSSHPQNYGGMA